MLCYCYWFYKYNGNLFSLVPLGIYLSHVKDFLFFLDFPFLHVCLISHWGFINQKIIKIITIDINIPLNFRSWWRAWELESNFGTANFSSSGFVENVINRSYIMNSASADGSPRSRVCARFTLHSAHHRHQRKIFFAHMSEEGDG